MLRRPLRAAQRPWAYLLTTHRLEEAERLCDRVAIIDTNLRAIGRPDELREQLFRKTLVVRTLIPLSEPDRVFGGRQAVESWHLDASGACVLAVSDPIIAAPEVTRALVAAGADVLSITESRHSLEDVYLELKTSTPRHAHCEPERDSHLGHLPQGA